MRVAAVACAMLALLGGATAVYADDVLATVGTNAVHLPEHTATYRLSLDGSAARVADAALPTSTPSPDGRFAVAHARSRSG